MFGLWFNFPFDQLDAFDIVLLLKTIPVTSFFTLQTQGMAQCYINIYHSHVAVRQFDKALHILEIGIALLKFQYGTKAARKRVFGYFYCNVGDVHFNSGNFTKATGCYDECIVAYQTAEDFESEETKQEWIAEIKEKIKKSRQQTGK